jgi:hypothetical protein
MSAIRRGKERSSKNFPSCGITDFGNPESVSHIPLPESSDHYQPTGAPTPTKFSVCSVDTQYRSNK